MIKKGLLFILTNLLVIGAFAQGKSIQDFQTWYDAELKLNLKNCLINVFPVLSSMKILTRRWRR